MYSYFKGILIENNEENIVVDVNGVGYELFCPASTKQGLPELENEVTIYSYLHVREDILKLYGFSTKQEKDCFIILISVSGLGPKVAMSILSNISISDFRTAILEGDLAVITKIPGIGKKSAERILLELKTKISKLCYSDMDKTIFFLFS